MAEITFEQYYQNIVAKENATKEDDKVTEMLRQTANAVIQMSELPKVVIKSDYDCDGLTSAYQMLQLLKALNPDIQVDVQPNDRRGSYGLNSEVNNAENLPHIILDMGSNQLDLLDSNIGKGRYIVIDHHLVEDKDMLEQFRSNNDGRLCNPHTVNDDDTLNAQYCTAGLVYRIYEESKEICKANGRTFHTNEIQENTMSAVSAIGTATDIVNVLDVHSKNREILKRGIEAIDNATHQNFDEKIGALLTMTGISEKTTSTQLAFNAGAFINSASRMSAIMEMNGAKRLFDVLTNPEIKEYGFAKDMEYFQEMNTLRKELCDKVYQSPEYKKFVEEHTVGEKVLDNFGVFIIPDNVTIPHNLAGLVANKLAEGCDKSIIVLTKTGSGDYTGSGRSVSSIETSLYAFTKSIAEQYNLTAVFGGHNQAIGISNLPKKEMPVFLKGIEENLDKVKSVSFKDRDILNVKEFLNPDGFEILNKCEPLGQGNKPPCVLCEGKEIYKNSGFKRKNGEERKDWKDVKISVDIETTDDAGKVKTTKERLSATDWSYNPDKYIADEKKGIISFVAEVSVNTYKNDGSLQLTSKFDRLQYIERAKEMGITLKGTLKQNETDKNTLDSKENKEAEEFDEFDI